MERDNDERIEKEIEKLKSKFKNSFDELALIFEKHKMSWSEISVMGLAWAYLCITYQKKRFKGIKGISKELDMTTEIIKEVNRIVYNSMNLADHIYGEVGREIKYRKMNFFPGSLKKRFELLHKYNYKCAYCGRGPPEVTLELDHIYPKSKGGKDDIGNLIVACKDCNRGKSDKIIKIERKLDDIQNGRR